MKYILPWLLSSYVNRKMEEMGNRANFNESQRRREGEVNINVPNQEKKNKNYSGEYVDFEEIKD